MAKQFKLRRRIDSSLAITGIALSVFGLVMVLSASQVSSAQQFGNSYHFFVRQLAAWLAGMVVFFYFLRVKLEDLFEQRGIYLVITLILLVAVVLVGTVANGAKRWIDLGVFNLQPSEFAKLFLAIYFSGWFAAKGDKITSFTKGLLPFLAILLVIAGLIYFEKDFGTMLIMIILSLSIFFVAKSNVFHIIGIICLGGLLLVSLILISPYRAQRLETFLTQSGGSSTQDNLGAGYHNYQAKIAIGSGGWWGEGFGQGMSKYNYLPEAQTDSIFAVITEELGFVRTSLVVLAYFFIAWRGYLITLRANSKFSKYLACVLTTALVTQALINIGGIMGIIPLTGVPLPFISYGGSSMIVCLGMLGLLTNVSREVEA
jgi:cell division protein FtsW